MHALKFLRFQSENRSSYNGSRVADHNLLRTSYALDFSPSYFRQSAWCYFQLFMMLLGHTTIIAKILQILKCYYSCTHAKQFKLLASLHICPCMDLPSLKSILKKRVAQVGSHDGRIRNFRSMYVSCGLSLRLFKLTKVNISTHYTSHRINQTTHTFRNSDQITSPRWLDRSHFRQQDMHKEQKKPRGTHRPFAINSFHDCIIPEKLNVFTAMYNQSTILSMLVK